MAKTPRNGTRLLGVAAAALAALAIGAGTATAAPADTCDQDCMVELQNEMIQRNLELELGARSLAPFTRTLDGIARSSR